MTTMITLIAPALAASLFMLLQMRARLLPAIAAAASGLELLVALRLVALGLPSLGLILGGALVVTGALLHARVSGKPLVTAATVITLIGAIQVAGQLL